MIKRLLLAVAILVTSFNAWAYDYRVPTADGAVTVDAENSGENYHELTVLWEGGTPTAGTVTVEASPRNSEEYFDILSAQELDATAPIFVQFTGNVADYRFTFAGVTGAPQAHITDTASTCSENSWYGSASILDAMETSQSGSSGLGVFIQDQTTPPLFIKANNVTGATTLTVATAVDDTSITVDDDTEVSVGDYLGLFSTTTNRFYAGTVLTKPGGNVLTLDSRIDSVFSIGDTVGAGITDMSVNGSVTPVIFSIRGQDPGIAVTADITRLIITCTDDAAVDLTKFCGGAVLTKGIQMRRVDGVTSNIINWKSNFELAGSMYDWTPLSSGVGQQGIDGFISRLTFGGQSKVGVVLRLAPGEEIEFIIQDDLSGITKLEIMVEGHVVQ